MARSSATASTSRPSAAGTTATRSPPSLRRASRGRHVDLRAHRLEALLVRGGVDAHDGRHRLPRRPAARRSSPSGSSRRPAAQRPRAVAVASTRDAELRERERERLVLAGLEAHARRPCGATSSATAAARRGLVEAAAAATPATVTPSPTWPHVTACSAAKPATATIDDEQRGRRPHVAAVPGAEAAQRASACGDGGLPGPGRECVHALPLYGSVRRPHPASYSACSRMTPRTTSRKLSARRSDSSRSAPSA